MAAPMQKTSTPGVYKRGSRYVVVYRHNGKQKKESARTIADARALKARRTSDIERGEFFEASKQPFRDYAEDWVANYHGRGSKGFRESTRADYRRDLHNWVFPYFGDRLRLSEITPKHFRQLIAHLANATSPTTGEPLSDAAIKKITNPVRACLATAVDDGLIRTNPTTGASFPNRARVEIEEDDEEGRHDEVRPLTREQLRDLLAVVRPDARLMLKVLAATGLRISELYALRWRDIQLDGSEPHVRVRRAWVKARRFEPPKSKHGKRDVPLSAALVFELRQWRKETEWPGDDDIVFPSQAGSPRHYRNDLRRVLKPAVEEVGAGWAGFHTFRHTYASLLIARGENILRISRLLGHHAASFTLDTYSHLMPEDRAEALDLDAVLPESKAEPEMALEAVA
jgi:integrase